MRRHGSFASLALATLLVIVGLLLQGCPAAIPNRPPVAVIKANPTGGEAPLTVKFDGSDSYDTDGEIISYLWDFGDGSAGNGVTTTHVYSSPGSYEVTLTVTDNDGALGADKATVEVIRSGNTPPQAKIAITSLSFTDSLQAIFDISGSSDSDGAIEQFEFDFGDGTSPVTGTDITQPVIHTYAEAGIFTPSLTVTDDGGATGTDSVDIAFDDFNDNAIESALWNDFTVGSGPTVQETNQRLEITHPADSKTTTRTTFGAGYRSTCLLRGDFDIRVSYELLQWPSANGVRVGLGAGPDSSRGSGLFDLVERSSRGSSSDFPGEPREVYVTHFADGVQGTTVTTDLSGKLRLVRKGSEVAGYYFKSDGWVLLNSFSNASTDDFHFKINSWSHDEYFTDQEVRIAFDNFIMNKGKLICP